jgi:hypothetical protein
VVHLYVQPNGCGHSHYWRSLLIYDHHYWTVLPHEPDTCRNHIFINQVPEREPFGRAESFLVEARRRKFIVGRTIIKP